MKSIWFFILISIVINFIGAIGKANQKKRPILSTVKNANKTDYDYKSLDMMPKIDENYSNNLGYDSSTIIQGLDYDQKASFPYETEEATSIQNESMEETEKVLDIGLSELQYAIVMSEVLNKPLSLRKK